MIEVKNLSQDFKIYKKDPGFWGSVKSLWNREFFFRHALKNITFNIQEGEMVGLVGANGAGKTTLVKILSGILYPTQGHVRVLNFDPTKRSNEYRRSLSLIMGQKSQLWWDLPAYDSFLLLKEIYQIPNDLFHENINSMKKLLQINDQLHVQVRRLSLGERMKVELMAALLHRPKVIFLDEPTIGLDYASQHAVRNFLLNYQKTYRPLILLTSHYMKDIEELCPRIILMKEGEIIFDDQLSVMKKKYTEKKIINFRVPPTELIKLSQKIEQLKQFPGSVSDITQSDEMVTLRVPQRELNQIVTLILKDLTVEDISLSDLDIGEVISRELNA